jgi:hypothetical protein
MNFLLSVVLVIIIVYVLIWLFSKSKTLSNYQKSSDKLDVDVSKLTKPDSTKYGYTFWLYIKSWTSTDKPKCIFHRAQGSGSTVKYFPQVTLGTTTNDLTVKINDIVSGSVLSPFQCILTNIPIQTWINITISLNNKVLDIYMNGKLTKTCVASFSPGVDNTAGLVVCSDDSTVYGPWNGQIARLEYYSDMISSQEAWNIYKKGPGGSLLGSFLNEYKIKLSFLKGGDEKANITI